MKSEAYYQGIRARMSDLRNLGFDTNCPYESQTDEKFDWWYGWYDAKRFFDSINQSLTIFNEAGIDFNLTHKQ